MAEKFLDKVYGVTTAAETEALYDDWAATYDDEMRDNTYVTPSRCAAALAQILHRPDAPILDFGCGTGLSGGALAGVGFQVIDGVDLSAGMLETAKQRGVYRTLGQITADGPLGIEPGTYDAIAAVGVISTGAAPAGTLDTLMDLLLPGGLIVFSLNDHALADPSFEGRVRAHIGGGSARQHYRDYGEHLPGHDLKSVVYVLEKA